MKTFFIKYLYAFVILIGSAGGAGILLAYQTCNSTHVTPTSNNKSVDYLLEIKTQEEFDMLEGEPLSTTFNNVSTIKLTYNIADRKLYFIQSKKYKYHIDFCAEVLGYNLGLELFNTYNYGDMKRREYYLATLNYYNDSKTYTLEFVSEDQINSDQIKEVYNDVKAKTFFGKEIKLFIDNDHLQSLDDTKSFNEIPRVYPREIYGAQNFQAINTGTCFGYLHFVNDLKKDFNTISSDEIIIIKGTVIALPYCQAVITNSLQTPLSHINLLTHNRGTPSAAVRNIWENENIKSFDGELVKLVISDDSVHVETASLLDAQDFWLEQKKLKGSTKKITLTSDLSVTTIQPIEKLNIKSNNIVGSKASNFAELSRLQKKYSNLFKTPEAAFAIPFYFYSQHISQTTVAKEISKLIGDSVYQNNIDSTDAQLKRIRTAIKKAPLNSSLLSSVKNLCVGYSSFRFRSSTNIEDIEGFNGAGLYDSKTGSVNDTSKTIERAIKDVWASVFTLRAYTERKMFGIKEPEVMMGVLVHRGFPDEAANGVAITKNIYRENFPGFVVNVQAGEVPVVAPPDGVVCEQFICMRADAVDVFHQNVVTDYITHSSITNGNPVLTQAQIVKLYDALERVQSHFRTMKSFLDQACDVEFKFEKDGSLYLKQVRPYN